MVNQTTAKKNGFQQKQKKIARLLQEATQVRREGNGRRNTVSALSHKKVRIKDKKCFK